MKKIILMIFTTLLLFTLSYAENKIKVENGKKIVYSDNNLAKGLIKNIIYNSDKNMDIVISEIYFNDGIPAGDFKLYNKNGELVIDGKGKWNDEGFEGTIESPLFKGKVEGLFHINTDFLISYIGDNYEEITLKNIINGKIFLYSQNGEIEVKNGAFIKMIAYYNNGNLKSTLDIKNDKIHGEYLEYYENGNLKSKGTFKDDIRHGKFLQYDSLGNIISEEEYQNGNLIRKIK